MILIADSGSTKTKWTLTDSTGATLGTLYTDGLNPFYRDETHLYNVLVKELLPALEGKQPEAIFFYGAGCSQKDKVERMQNALKRAFPLVNISVEHDLTAAARATCGTDAGIACILGTGSNSCLFDGIEVIDNVTNLAFILGDEGSGGYFGRKLLQAYFYREFPDDLAEKIRKEYNMDKEYILNRVYEGPLPNQFVAGYSRFMSDNNNLPFFESILYDGFKEFLVRHVMKYKGAKTLPVHFIGSIADVNKHILHRAMDDLGLHKGIILRSPNDGLIKYHTGKLLPG